jgi:hypothetical protein
VRLRRAVHAALLYIRWLVLVIHQSLSFFLLANVKMKQTVLAGAQTERPGPTATKRFGMANKIAKIATATNSSTNVNAFRIVLLPLQIEKEVVFALLPGPLPLSLDQ